MSPSCAVMSTQAQHTFDVVCVQHQRVAESDTEAEAEAKKYPTFWKEFGKTIKLGIIEDTQNRVRLAKLLRFQTSKSGSKEIGLDTYIEGMKEGQKSIYYLAGICLLVVHCGIAPAMLVNKHCPAMTKECC